MSTYDWKTNRVRWAKLFNPAIKKYQSWQIVRKINPVSGFSISEGALNMLDERMYNIIGHLCCVRGTIPLTTSAAEEAIERLFPENAHEWVLSAARKATLFSKGNRLSGSPLLIDVKKVHTLLDKEVARDTLIPLEISCMLVAAVEQLVFELLKFAVSYAQQLEESKITEETIAVTMEAQMDLSLLIKKSDTPPTIQAYIKLSYSEAVREFFLAETNFIHHLDTVAKVFVDTFESQFNLSETTIQDIFFNLTDLMEIAQNLATDIEDVLEKSKIHKSLPVVGDCFLNFTETKEYENFLAYAAHLSTALESLWHITHDEDMFRKMWIYSADFALATKYQLPIMLCMPLHHMRHYVEALLNILSKATRSSDDFVQISVPLFKDALSILKPAASSLIPEKYPMMEIKDSYLEFPSMEARVSHAMFTRLSNTIDGAQDIDLYKSRYNLLHQGRITVDDKTRYLFALEHMLLICQQILTLTIISPSGDNLLIVLSMQTKTIRLRTADCVAYEQWMSALGRIVSQSYIAKCVCHKQEEYERNLPDLTPDPTNYPFSEPDGPHNVHFEEHKKIESAAPLIKGGTLVKLIERLTHPQSVDLQYLTQFLLTYRMFCQPQELLRLLLQRYEVPPPKGVIEKPQLVRRFAKRYSNPVKVRVLNVLKIWVDKHFYDFEIDKDLLRQLLEFIQTQVRHDGQRERQCQAVVRVIKSKKSRAINNQLVGLVWCAMMWCDDEIFLYDALSPRFSGYILDVTEFRFKFIVLATSRLLFPSTFEHKDLPPDIFSLPLETTRIHVLTLHPTELARQLTLIDSELYRAIQPSELVGQQWTKKEKETRSPHVLAFIRHFNRISQFTIRTILEMSDLEERQLVLHAFIEVLFELRNLNNFNSLMAIKEAVRNSAINRLKFTWAAIPERKIERIAAIEEEVSGTNYAHLRQTIAQASPPCIPFLGLYLTDITFMEDGSPDYLISEDLDDIGPRLINFSKRRLVGETCMTIQQFQHRTYNLQLHPQLQAFLHELPSVTNDGTPLPDSTKAEATSFEESMFRLSLAREPRNSAAPEAGIKLLGTKDTKLCRDVLANSKQIRSLANFQRGSMQKEAVINHESDSTA
eukprot:gene1967-5051_t